ncbi:hypothetical protein [Spartinivicinus poritis]|uniref:Uncharacterized protein n=1 Tax=Spartinivicinus poritis TaxID=2994640 RepID=A0ABT5UI02_9GAMM|nr:hypothetical protein [Spartinivicinus sp. A2-2]MDE1466014.1 hypothetical protein [Spartinivicinus sp. A2-2]
MANAIETLRYAKQLKQLQEKVFSESTKGFEKIKLLKDIKKVREALTVKVKTTVNLFQQLLAGEFNKLNPKVFIKQVKAILEEIKQPVVDYLINHLNLKAA